MTQTCCHAQHGGCRCGTDSCVKRVPIFSMLDPRKLAEIAALVRPREYEPKDTLFSAGERIAGIYIIRHGAVKLVRGDEDGHESIVSILRPGDFYGGDSMFHDSHSRETALAMEPSGICFIPEGDLRALLSRDPEIAMKIIQYYSSQHVRNMNMLEILAAGDSMRRVCRFLLWQTEQDPSSRVTLSQEEMARMLGLAPETLNRKLAVLKKAGIIRMEGHRGISVLQPQALNRR